MKRGTITFVGWRCLNPFTSLRYGTDAFGPLQGAVLMTCMRVREDFNRESVYITRQRLLLSSRL